ncbi:hypothetical protein EDD85DRAFT_954368 [Armillaria nabsnona]|nr:hypothetical protein EDD85DRAFT_954368 [Armillaria nabsnona]
MATEEHFCKTCRKSKPLTDEHFKPTFGSNGSEDRKTCHTCTTCIAEHIRQKRKEQRLEKENTDPSEVSSSPASHLGHTQSTSTENEQSAKSIGKEEDESDFLGLPEVTLNSFLDAISISDNVKAFSACVSVAELDGDCKERANLLAKEIWDWISYCFVYHSKYSHKRSSLTRFVYHCTQIVTCQHKPKKQKRPGAVSWDKDQMDTF